MNKTDSFTRINYCLRPNKQVERKIIIDILHNIGLPISKYHYIGMGSIYYYDFIMMHKMLGIKKLTSLDDSKQTSRLKFNCPYDYITFEPLLSTEFFKKYNWESKNHLIWLDYDTSLISSGCLIDDSIEIARRCKDKDIVFVTLNISSQGSDGTQAEKKRIFDKYDKYLTVELKANMKDFKIKDIVQDVVLNIFADASILRKPQFYKLCSFTYRDGAKMYTLGGIFLNDEKCLKNLATKHVLINRCSQHIEEISIPLLTYKEKIHFDSIIKQIEKCVRADDTPGSDTVTAEEIISLTSVELKLSEWKAYVKYYRYIPTYYEGLI
ncbi:MAG: hypothetical protein Q8M98_11525 [Candidatus Cloacimonadaceae bacterium]|nr:hypothetical protein [Candidatus Cloacimonadaceae bacterium]